MRIAIVLAIAACSAPAAPTVTPTKPLVVAPARPAIPAAPIVDVEAVLLPDAGEPPVVVIVDADGRRSVAAAASWKDIVTGSFLAGPRPTGSADSLRALMRAWWVDNKQTPKELVERLATLPAPPHENNEGASDMHWGFSLRKGEVFPPPRNDNDPRAIRQAQVVGQIADELDAHPAVVVAAPLARATALVEAVAQSTGQIGVLHRGAIRRLRFQFVLVPIVATYFLDNTGLELVVSKAGMQIEVLKRPPIPVTADRLATAIADANKLIEQKYVGLVDVLVAPDADVQRLVDTLVALDQAGVKWIGLGLVPPPGSDQAKFRRERVKRVGFGQPRGNDIEKRDTSGLRALLAKQRDAFLACYDAAIVKQPDLQAEVVVQLWVAPDNTIILNAGAATDHEALEACFQSVVAKLKTPNAKFHADAQWLTFPVHLRQ